jgi:hypothetical protein
MICRSDACRFAVQGKALLDRIVAMLIGLRSAKERQVCESRSEYTVGSEANEECFFAHEQLRVYQSASEQSGQGTSL